MGFHTELAGTPVDIAPPFAGVSFRHFRGEADYPHIARLLTETSAADGGVRYETAERVAIVYDNLYNCDPYLDMIFADVDGVPVAYSRCLWEQELSGTRVYDAFGWVHPEYRLRGIGSAMLAANLARVGEIAATHDTDIPKKIVSGAAESDVGATKLFAANGFRPEWYLAEMVRDLAKPIEPAPLPEGLEVRTPGPNEYRKVFDADVEAFRDHHGATEPQESWYREWLESPLFQPELWRIAWDGDEIAGQVRTFIDHEQNAEYGRKRGWTEEISTRREYRKRGVARSLLTQSLEMLRDMAYDEAALKVHTDNPTGAYRLYERVGFVVDTRTVFYGKPLVV